jgi:adenylate kinase
MVLNLILLGPPGSGKGTVAQAIAEKEKIPHISTGDMLRSEVARKTPLGKKVGGLMKKGKYVSDDIINRLVESRFSKKDVRRGFLLDGYPRTLEQASELDGILSRKKMALNGALYLRVDDKNLDRKSVV